MVVPLVQPYPRRPCISQPFPAELARMFWTWAVRVEVLLTGDCHLLKPPLPLVDLAFWEGLVQPELDLLLPLYWVGAPQVFFLRQPLPYLVVGREQRHQEDPPMTSLQSPWRVRLDLEVRWSKWRSIGCCSRPIPKWHLPGLRWSQDSMFLLVQWTNAWWI